MKKSTPLLFVSAVVLLLSNFPPVMSVSKTSRSISSQGIIQQSARTPLLQGWGGVRLYEVKRFKDENGSARTEPPSEVFPGEVASDVELTMRLMKERGYNAIRAYFEDPRDEMNPRNLTIRYELHWVWNSEWFEKFVELARYYDLWMICDYHGYYQPQDNEDEWIQFWRDEIITPYSHLYDKLIWEPCNEPVIRLPEAEEERIPLLQKLYQRWINMCRALGDTHWIIASGVCFWSGLPKEEWYPDLDDPLNKTYLNYHWYYKKKYHGGEEWTIEGAQNYADFWTDVALRVQQKYNKPFLTTESGISGVDYDGATYDEVSLAFITKLVENFHREGMGYTLWYAGDWGSKFHLYGRMCEWGNEIPLPPT